jgi:phosphate:Na+ symporter
LFLSALNANVIEIEHALAIIIGANIGTTFTLVIGAIGGTADKRRLALANFIFKLLGGVVAFLLLDQLIVFTMVVFSVADPLMELVLLNTLVNVLMIVIFYPFLSPMEKWLKDRFSLHEPKGKSRFVKNVTTELPSVAILSLQKELYLMMKLSVKFVHKVIVKHQGPKKSASVWKKITYQPKDLLKEYMNLKSLEGELISYGIALQENNLNTDEASQLNSIVEALRTLVIGAKEFKDIIHNIKEMENSNEPMVAELLNELRKNATFNLGKIEAQLEEKVEPQPFTDGELKTEYNQFIHTLYQKLRTQKTDVPVSTLANVIQGVFSGLEYIRESFVTMREGEKENTKVQNEF